MRVLFIAYYFPPDSSSGSFRPFFFSNHLAEAGVEVDVLTARIEHFLDEQPVDQDFAERLDRGVAVTRCSVSRPREALLWLRSRCLPSRSHRGGTSGGKQRQGNHWKGWQAVKDTITDLLATPDPHVGWIYDCVRRGRDLIARQRPDVICATGSPWSGLVAGAILKKVTGVPLILDFRDPWTSNPSFERRGRLARRIDVLLERFVVEGCDGIIANTSTLREEFLARYPRLSRERITAITNGFEEYLPPGSPRPHQPLTITHTGDLYASRNPASLLEALKRVMEKGMVSKDEVRLQLVGGVECDDGTMARLLSEQALRQVVALVPRVGYREAQRYICEADLLLLIQPDFPLQIPRKLFDYMAVGKPVFCIAEGKSATAAIVRENGLGVVCDNSTDQIELALMDIIAAWKSGRLREPQKAHLDRFHNSRLTAQLQDFFSCILNKAA